MKTFLIIMLGWLIIGFGFLVLNYIFWKYIREKHPTTIKAIIKEMGFEVCNFPPDLATCDCCKQPYLQLYFQGQTDAERYFCKECILKEYLSNQQDLRKQGLL